MSNPSVPPYHSAPPRSLTDDERRTLLAVAEVLIPDVPGRPAASDAPDYLSWLDRALAARSDAFEEIMELIGRLRYVEPEGLSAELRTISDAEPVGFQALSSVLAGAYLMVPAVRRAIGYPGQEALPAAFDEAAEEIMSGILDPVIARGPIYVTPRP
jgi:hypothetical protein